MSDTPTNPVPGLTTPFAIVIAGGLIALAIYAGGVGLGKNTATTVAGAGTQNTTAPAVATATPVPTEISFAEVSDADHIRGAQNAKVTLIEYSDLECPYCRSFHPTVSRLMDEFPNDLRVVYRHFPLEAIHPQARISANASECAAAQGKFWEYIDYVFANTTSGADLAQDKLIQYARAAGVPNTATFTSCLTAKTYDDVVAKDSVDAQSAGARGTPYSILVGPNGEKIPVNGAQSFDTVKAQISDLLAG